MAPSSTQRLAVAKPMPVPAAAVTTTTLPVEQAVARRRVGGRRAPVGVRRVAAASVIGVAPLGSGGRPRTRSPMMFFWISLDPP